MGQFSLFLTATFAATPYFLLFFTSFHKGSLPPLLPPLLVGLYFCHHSFFAATFVSPCFLQFSLLLTATFAATPCFLLFFTSFHKGSLPPLLPPLLVGRHFCLSFFSAVFTASHCHFCRHSLFS